MGLTPHFTDLAPTAPFAPERVAVLSRPVPPDLLEYGREFLAGRASDWPHPEEGQWEGWRFPREKADVMIWMVGVLVNHYFGVPEAAFDSWLGSFARREDLSPSGLSEHVAHAAFRFAPGVRPDAPPHDWWLFLLPEGCPWNKRTTPSARVLVLAVPELASVLSSSQDQYHTVHSALTVFPPKEGWGRLARLPELAAARLLNAAVARTIEMLSRAPDQDPSLLTAQRDPPP